MIDIDDVELSQILSDTLRSRAEPVTVPADDDFDPTRRAAWAVEVEAPRRPWARAIAAAAAMVAVVAGVAAVVQSSDMGGGGVRVGAEMQPAPSSVVPLAPGDVLAPTSPPEGLDLWGVSWSTQVSHEEPLSSPLPVDVPAALSSDLSPQWAQLFGDPGNAERLLLVEAYRSREALDAGASPQDETVTVRGREGTLSGPSYQDGAFDVRAVHWEEAGRWFSAGFKGMTPAEAVVALDGLQVRPEGGHGFDAPGDGSVTLLEDVLEPTSPELPVGYFTYAEEAPSNVELDSPAVQVLTRPGTGHPTFAYLRTWLNGTRDADGTVTSYLPEPEGNLNVVRPDGTEIAVMGWGPGVSREVAEPVAASVQPTTASGLEDLWTEANDRTASLPLIAELQLPSGTVQIRGDEGEPRALCLQVGAGIACPNIGNGPAMVGDEGELAAGLALGDAWFVAAATTGTPPDIQGGGVAVETGSDATWNFALVRPGEGHDQVTIFYDGGDHATRLHRP